MESLCTVGSDDRLCAVRVGILSLNTPTHQGAPEQCVITDLLFLLYLGLVTLHPSSRYREMFVCETHVESYAMLSYPTSFMLLLSSNTPHSMRHHCLYF